jgi:glycosyltransferase involved in cell wall biosynthesis
MPSAQPKVSVITVCYNSAATIENTIKTIAMQDYDNLEYIVVDGKSKDNTLEIVAKFGSLVSQCVSEKDKGNYDAYNKGLKLATGDVIGFLNSDDFYPTADVISRVAKAFAADPRLDAVYSDLCYVKQHETDKIVRYWRSSEYKPGLFLKGWVPPHPTFFVRKRVYDKLGGFDISYRIAADWELLARFIEVNRIRTRYLPGVLVHMQLGGLTNRSWGNVWKQNKEIWRAAKAHGLHPTLSSFVLGKAWSRGRQFITRER